MPSCARQLANSADIDSRSAGPLKKHRRQPPTPLAPMTLSRGGNFVSIACMQDLEQEAMGKCTCKLTSHAIFM